MSFKDYVYALKGKLIIVVIIIVLVALIYYAYDSYAQMIDEAQVIEKKISKAPVKIKTKEKKLEVVSDYYVDVKGMVVKPGVYGLSKNARVIDAINLAGGLLGEADTSLINLSMKIIDGMLIKVYSKSEVRNIVQTKKEEAIKESLCTQNVINDACVKSETKITNNKVNINEANIESLMTLPGIGEAKAKAIIEYRQKKRFSKAEEIMEVSGIGEALFAQISQSITV